MITNKQLLDTTKGKTGKDLRSHLYMHCSKHKVFKYPQARNILFERLKCKNIYRKQNIRLNELSCEHIVPQSLYNRQDPYAGDLHHLFLCDYFMNFQRSNFRFKQLDDEKSVKLDYSDPECSRIYKGSFEPNTLSKGIVSRAVAYFVTTYPEKLYLLPKIIDIKDMLDWNDLNPPTAEETKRNRDIYNIQFNYNPFIVSPDIMRKTFSDINTNEPYQQSQVPYGYYDKSKHFKFIHEELETLRETNKKQEQEIKHLVGWFIKLQKYQEMMMKEIKLPTINTKVKDTWETSNEGQPSETTEDEICEFLTMPAYSVNRFNILDNDDDGWD